MQLDEAARGFSLNRNGPLDMRMGDTQLSASDIVNFYDEEKIADILFQYGEEKLSRIIAKKIVMSRPIVSTLELAKIIKSCFSSYSLKKIHPATKSFQALSTYTRDDIYIEFTDLNVSKEDMEKLGNEKILVLLEHLLRFYEKKKKNEVLHLTTVEMKQRVTFPV